MKKYISIALSVLLCGACTLERENFNEITPDSFFRTETDLELAVNALYYDFQPGLWASGSSLGGMYEADDKGYQIYSDMTTDCLWCNWGWGWDTMYYHQWTNNDGSLDSQNWFFFSRYRYLSKARNVIRRIEASPVAESVKSAYIGEAEALRGWMALGLYDLFGPVPVASDDVLDDPETFAYLPRLTDEEYDRMMEGDLLDAIGRLPEMPAQRGRMAKGAARMVLLKYYMIRGQFTKAEEIARDLYAMNYSLQSDYAYVFSKEGIGNSEIIHCLPCNSGSESATNYLVAAYLPGDYPWADKATGWGGYIMPWDFYDTYEAGDARLNTLKDSYVNKRGKQINRSDMNGAVILKYGLDPDMMDGRCFIDVVVYRYADVLLSLAECICRNSGGPTPEAVELVNRVRTRAKLPELSGAAVSSKDGFLEAILSERGHEFYMEGFRRQDLIRFGKYVEYANARIAKANEAGKGYFTVDDSHDRMYIPNSFIKESKDQIRQNPGY